METDPSTLPDNYSCAIATLKRTENKLLRDKASADIYQAQIQDMLDRKVSRKVSDEEIASWKGAKYYISHQAVSNPNSESTPTRIVFNSSQEYQGISLNEALYKGPDAYMNNLLGLLLRWREEKVAIVGDIKKMYNSVHLEMTEQHCHRFLWRDLNTDRTPDIYVMTRVNIGDRPAGQIATEALYKTADLFHSDSPSAAKLLKDSTYVDDILDSI